MLAASQPWAWVWNYRKSKKVLGPEYLTLKIRSIKELKELKELLTDDLYLGLEQADWIMNWKFWGERWMGWRWVGLQSKLNNREEPVMNKQSWKNNTSRKKSVTFDDE